MKMAAMFHSIAVTTDFSEISRQAFLPAAVLARTLEARLQVVHVDSGPEIHTTWQCASASRETSELRRATIAEKLDRFIAEEPAFRGIHPMPKLIVGEAADALRALDEREDMDLIVVSSHAHEDVKHFVPGSFAARVIHLARCPVLILRSFAATPPSEAFYIRRVLVPIDFSPPSMAALEPASSLARAFGASLEILSVIEGGDPGDEGTEQTEKLRVASAGLACGETPRIVVRSGKPSEEILAEAAARDIDLIVMGSRGLSPVEQITLGSVAESAIQNASCPVLVVKEHLVLGSGDSGPDARALETTAGPMR